MQGPPPYGAAPPPPPLEAPHGIHEHDGFYFRVALGFGRLSTTMASDNSADYGGTPTRPVSVNGSFAGGAGAFELAFGGTPAPGLVLGGGIYASNAPHPPKQDVTTSGATPVGLPEQATTLAIIGPFVDYYIDPKGGWHVQGALGFASVVTKASDTSNNDPRVQQRDQVGFGFMVGGGYDAWVSEQWSLGGTVRLLYGSTSTNASTTDAFTYTGLAAPEILFTATYH